VNEIRREDVLSFDEFVARVSTELNVETHLLESSARWSEDIGVDSLGMYELMIIIETFGADLKEGDLQRMKTVEDAYLAYSRSLE
jgi:acyl carrier protein